MPTPIIRIENIGKKYLIRHQIEGRRGYVALRDVIAEGAQSAWSSILRRKKTSEPDASREEFWAVKDVSFDVREGEVVGIVGRNGAGKSTLLKILSRITEPTAGRVTLNGRVASLLEVGTGFHPELTGRENVFLNGSVLGMSRAEIKRKFDEIVAFAEVEKFLDTPVKRYSSGMYVRLAFAVAAHLEPEILIVDEVLAVGDAEFQKKCLGKMGEVAKQGRTVLFVSHNMSVVQRLCSRGVLMADGKVIADGPSSEIVGAYLASSISKESTYLRTTTDRSGSGEVRLTGFWIEDNRGRRLENVVSGQELRFALQYQVSSSRKLSGVSFGIALNNLLGEPLTVLYSDYAGITFSQVAGEGIVKFHVPELPLNEGNYPIGVRVLVDKQESDWPKSYVGQLNVLSGNYRGIRFPAHSGAGPLLLDGRWESDDSRIESLGESI